MQGNDLGKDSVFKLVLKLAIPAMFAQFVNVLYSIVDRIYISRLEGIGDYALAGVGVCGPIVTFISSFTYLAGLGGSALMAMKLGEKNPDGARKILSNCTVLLTAFAAVLTAVFLAVGRPLIMMFGATENTVGFATQYYYVYVAGTMAAILSLGLNFFITAQGYSGTAMLTVVLGAALNIALDPLFMFVFDMGVTGAALATIVSQAASAVWVLLFLCSKKTQVKIAIKRADLSFPLMGRIMMLGISPFLIVATDSVMVILLNTMLSRTGGSDVDMLIAAATVVLSFMQLIFMPMQGITAGTQPLISYNYGADRPDRVKKSALWTLVLCLVFTTVMFTISQTMPRLFVKIFTDDMAVSDIAVNAIKIYTLGLIPLSFQYAFVDGLTALGASKTALCLSLFRKLAVMTTCTVLLPLCFGATAVFWAEPIADIAAGIVSTTVFFFMINRILRRPKRLGV